MLKAAPVEQPHHSSHIGLILFLVFLAAAIGGIAYFVLRGSKPGKPAKKANYTL
jgi:flagellar basal body-associated protein FliL